MGNNHSKHGVDPQAQSQPVNQEPPKLWGHFQKKKKKKNSVAPVWVDYITKEPQPIPDAGSVAVPMHKGESIRIINTQGDQVVATWALAYRYDHIPAARAEAAVLYPKNTSQVLRLFPKLANKAAGAPLEYMSMSHTQSTLDRWTPIVSDTLVDQKRAPILKLVEDTSSGLHDTLTPACDRWLYAEMGVYSHHGSCFDNYWDALFKLQASRKQKQSKENEAQNNWVKDQGLEVLVNDLCSNSNVFPVSLYLFSDGSQTREFVRLEAMRDMVIVLSVCLRNVPRLNDASMEKSFVVFYEVLPKGRGEQSSGQSG
ncbi:hypothetical protein PMIN04_004058 [Paraphaeosphaeria minitans]|uniref:DUF1989 domain-containing protein n=1 Tax=Paraphaeosphaeria minitans TaxID=565426 RepID=A0A9P6GHT3_9PLEO|nr:hypothetical protein PMIN01_07563 [Paraphaeosphaeria minitans]